MKAKHQRLTLLLLAVVAVLGAVLLAMSSLKDQAAYFYAPADVTRKGAPQARTIRIGGMVEERSVRHAGDGVTMDFLVGDETDAVIRVRFKGIVPDLFKEGSGVVAQGRFQPDGLFVADEILAKHDESYMPPEAAGERHKTGSLK
ncbi:MAG: cytochrome c maturation protein CcmE [Sphingosinicella sp.]|nr:cytochrome c maturation protein CcmE [Sphingosinicella sp.]